MHALKLKITVLMMFVGLMVAPHIKALPAATFASISRLASGKWVRVAVPQDGIYQITAAELSQMGFSDINQVGVYGTGGHLLSEVLDGSAPDDLQPVPSLVSNGKLCFYAQGPVGFSLNGNHFERTLNAYANQGYYFLTEENAPLRVTTKAWQNKSGGTNHTTGYAHFYHEEELVSLTNSGKDLLGEKVPSGGLSINYTLPGICSPTVGACVRVAAQISSSAYGAGGTVVADMYAGNKWNAITFDSSTTFIGALTSNMIYDVGRALGTVTLPAVSASGRIRVSPPRLSPSSGTSNSGTTLDYIVLTYQRTNSLLDQDNAQTLLTIKQLGTRDTVTLAATATTKVWNLSFGQVQELQTKTSGTQVMVTPSMQTEVATLVAFDPQQTLLSVNGWERVYNQDIHGTTTPHLVILSYPDLLDEADRVANLHRQHDGMDVLVVTPQEVFNEFSSGTPDAMAVRLMCKMFYDRDPQKFRYLLIMGQALFDNRNILSSKPCQVITYETDNSGDFKKSCGTDDFFGMLDDGSGVAVDCDIVRLGVGRITSSGRKEAKSDVDKLIKYVTNPDYGVWRNNVFLSADEGNNNIHVSQAEGIEDILVQTLNTGMIANKDYIPMFGKAVNENNKNEADRTCPEACRYMLESLDRGQYFATYVGHASATQFTAKSHLWTINNAKQSAYEHLPIFTTACCDATLYDSATRGIAEHMFHKADGGAIAMVASTRSVYSTGNDLLNRAFVNAMFSAGPDGEMPRLGDAYMACKQWFGTDVNSNKLMFMLLGDPAMGLNYPRNLMKVTKINNINVSGESAAWAAPLQRVRVEAQVNNASGTLDRSFNGSATLTIYGPERIMTVAYGMGRRIHYPRTLLAQVEGTVQAGKFTADVVIPRNVTAAGEGDMLVSVYAHKTGTDQMVNGVYDKLSLRAYDASLAITDNQNPVIQEMYFENPWNFAYNDLVPAVPTLHVTVTDNEALNSTLSEVAGGMLLTLDGGKATFAQVKNYATFTDNARRMDIQFPVKGLDYGPHTLEFQVQDMMGNMASRTISFVVGQTTSLKLVAESEVATSRVTFDVTDTTLPAVPEVTLKVVDVAGNLVWQRTITSFPYTWNLKGSNGKRVANGVYRYYGTYSTDDHYGGTECRDLVVVAP